MDRCCESTHLTIFSLILKTLIRRYLVSRRSSSRSETGTVRSSRRITNPACQRNQLFLRRYAEVERRSLVDIYAFGLDIVYLHMALNDKVPLVFSIPPPF